MKRNVKFLLHGEMVSGELISKNKYTAYVRTHPCGKVFARRIKQHHVVIAPLGIEYPEDFKNLPGWYLSYQRFLEARSKKVILPGLVKGKSFSGTTAFEAIKKRAAEMLLAQFEIARGI